MSSAPVDYENNKVTLWILTYAYFHRQDLLISERELLEAISNELLQTLPTRQHLLRLGWNLVNQGLLENRYQHELLVSINDEGIFQFRKHLQPLIERARIEGDLNKTIDGVDADKNVKKKIKDFFKNNVGLSQDEIQENLKQLMWTLGKEGITIIFNMITSSD